MVNVSVSRSAALRRFRLRKSLSQEQLAEQAGLAVRTVREVEAGRARPRDSTIRLLAEALGLSESEHDELRRSVGPQGHVEAGARQKSPPRVDRTALADGRTVPAELPRDTAAFVGRDEQLAALTGELSAGADSHPRPIVVSGPAGVGKTAVAVHWGHRQRESFPDGQLYVDLRGHANGEPVSPIVALAAFLRALGVAGDDIPSGLNEAAAFFRSTVADRSLLVVLDNAHSPDQVRPLLPGGPGTFALITSRDKLSGLIVRDSARPVPVDHFAPEESSTLLNRLLETPRPGMRPEDTGRLAEHCAHLPLALRIAAANLVLEPRLTVPNYLESLRSDRLSTLSVDGDPESAIESTLSHSYRGLTEPERELLRRLALVAGPDFTLGAAAALSTEPSATARVLLRLQNTHLVELHIPGRFRLHDLVRLFVEKRLRAEESETHAPTTRLLEFYCGLDEADRSPENDNIAAAVTRHHGHPLTWRLVARLGADLHEGHGSPDMPRLLRLALESAREHDDLPGQAAMYRLLSMTHWFTRDYDAAIADGESALRIARRVHDRDLVASALADLGTYQQMRGDTVASLSYREAGLALQTRDTRGRIIALTNIAWSRLAVGRASGAQEAVDESVRLMATLDDPVLDGWVKLRQGFHYGTLGRYAESEKYSDQAVELFEAHPSPRGMLAALGARVIARLARGALREAHADATASLRIAEDEGLANVLPLKHLKMAEVRSAMGEHRAAIEIASRACRELRNAGSVDDAAWALCVVARAHLALGEHDAALAAAQNAAAIFEEVGHLDSLPHALRIVGEVERGLGDLAGARAAWKRARRLYADLGAAQVAEIDTLLASMNEGG